MPIRLSADHKYGAPMNQDMDPHKPKTSVMPGVARATLTIYEPGEECSDTLPTVREVLETCVDASTGLLSIERYCGIDLRIDPTPLRALRQDARVAPGYGFITNAALERLRQHTR